LEVTLVPGNERGHRLNKLGRRPETTRDRRDDRGASTI